MESGLYNKFKKIADKAQLSAFLKKIGSNVDAGEMIEILNQEKYNDLSQIDIEKYNSKTLKNLFETHYLYEKRMFDKAFLASFSVIENYLRTEYLKNSNQNVVSSSQELLKWARNRNIVNKTDYLHLEAFREQRNKISHELYDCSKEEAKLLLDIAVKMIKI